MKVLVCGGREYNNKEQVFGFLDHINRDYNIISLIIHGGAKGADSLAGEWANSRNKQQQIFKPDWNKFGRAAGMIRNKKMLEEGRPDLVVAFPGGRGTSDMVARSLAAQIEVIGSSVSTLEKWTN